MDKKRDWSRPRAYKHFDAPVGERFAKRAMDCAFVQDHSWLPLIHYTKETKRYKPKQRKTEVKKRPIMYASHRDACILAKYAHDLTVKLDDHYNHTGLTRNIIAYRRLGRANYDFSADAYRVARANSPCVVLCFDITGFFDHLDHAILKSRLKRILGVLELPKDWYAVFRHVARHCYVERDNLLKFPHIKARFESEKKTSEPLVTIAEIKKLGIEMHTNQHAFGIPQGTPISSALSNLYMIDVDEEMARMCDKRGALYQRYSDDILIICREADEEAIRSALVASVTAHRLELKKEKTERTLFDASAADAFQYLGFNVSPNGAVIRPSSLARQWRKLRRSLKRTRKIGEKAIAEGKAAKIYTKKLRRRFSAVGARNFSSYARHAAKAFDSKKIVKQVLRLERFAQRELALLDGSKPT
jgi:Reverse transcriptase (RNA-dependent DNA polymerase)